MKKLLFCLMSIGTWLCIWQLAAWKINSEIFLPTPGKVVAVLWQELLPSAAFWKSLLSSLLHIGAGFILGSVLGMVLAVLSLMSPIMEVLCWFPIRVLKSVPVASFVILTLLWLDAEGLAVCVPAIVVLPILYLNTLTGLRETNKRLLEMTDLFRIPLGKRIRYLYIPNALPYVLSAASLAVGMAWKSGVAAEVIGLVRHSIGNELYKAKLYLMIPELFAWTLVIVLLSVLCEMLVQSAINADKD